MFYSFNQNNSGGFFNTDLFVRELVIIEADNAEHANTLARNIGIYFNGVSSNRDCECCGDRWYPAWGDGDLTDCRSDYVVADTDEQANVIIHYLSGEILYLRDPSNLRY